MRKPLLRSASRTIAITAVAAAILLSAFAVASASPARGAASESPKSIVTSFYRAISGWNYGNAYSYIDPTGRPADFYKWAVGYDTTKKVTINTLTDPGYRIAKSTGTYACVAVRFVSTYLNNQTRTYGGWYMTRYTSSLHWRIYLPGSNIAQNAKAITPSKATCAAYAK